MRADNGLALCRPLVVTIGVDQPLERFDGLFRVIRVADEREVARSLKEHDLAVLVLGNELEPADAHRIVSNCYGADVPPNIAIIVCGGAETSLFQDHIDEDHIFYLSRGPLSESQLLSLTSAAAGRTQARSAQKFSEDVDLRQGLSEFLDRLSMQIDPLAVAELLAEAVRTHAGAERARCLVYDEQHDMLKSRDHVTQEERYEAPSVGLVGYVARTGERICLSPIGSDACYDQETDNPGGNCEAHFIAEPLIRSGGAVIGVVTADRDPRSKPFSAQDARTIGQLIGCATPTLHALLLQRAVIEDRRSAIPGGGEFYRQEALEHYAAGVSVEGHLLTTAPAWLRKIHWFVLGSVALGLSILLLANISDYATGQAVIRSSSQSTGGEPAGYELIAFVPASYEPQLVPGMPMTLRLHGYENSSELIRVDSVGPVILNRAEAGQYGGDVIPIAGPVVMLRARLTESTFGAPGRRYSYRPGLTGDVDIKVHSERALMTVVPALRNIVVR